MSRFNPESCAVLHGIQSLLQDQARTDSRLHPSILSFPSLSHSQVQRVVPAKVILLCCQKTVGLQTTYTFNLRQRQTRQMQRRQIRMHYLRYT